MTGVTFKRTQTRLESPLKERKRDRERDGGIQIKKEKKGLQTENVNPRKTVLLKWKM